MKQDEKNALLNAQHTIILDRQGKLSSTDYIDNKIVEGVTTREEYAEQIAERQGWREDINAAQEEIQRLEAIEVEPDEPIEE